MLVRDMRRLALIVGPIMLLFLIGAGIYGTDADDTIRDQITSLLQKTYPSDQSPLPEDVDHDSPLAINPLAGDIGSGTHHEIASASTPNGMYFNMTFGKHVAFNPNIIPHPDPNKTDTYIIVAQKKHPAKVAGKPDPSVFHVEIGCEAAFVDGVLQCLDDPETLPIAATPGNMCKEPIDFLGHNVGPHDARVFYGPDKPYTLFYSNSRYSCWGMWLQDFRVLVDWNHKLFFEEDFRMATEVQRPPPVGVVEKNFFMFWDADDQIYAHYDMFPKRSFAKMKVDGSVGKDLASKTQEKDKKCLSRYLPEPKFDPSKDEFGQPESIHQATNSLKITLCNRTDPSCKPTSSNTFLFTIIHFKRYYNFHSEYEPYVVMFQQRQPFEVWGVSPKPIWINGRKHLENKKTELFYITSMSWKGKEQKYHGYLDDALFLAFGIEDSRSGGIDVTAGELLKGMGLCSEA